MTNEIAPLIPHNVPVPRYRFGAHDRISIIGHDYVWQKSDPFGHVLARAEDLHLSESFTHQRIRDLFVSGDLVIYPNWFNVHKAERRNREQMMLLSDLSPEEQRGILRKVFYVTEFLGLELRDETSRSHARMKQEISAITEKFTRLEIQRQSKTERCGNKIEVQVPPTPSQLRRWVRRYCGCGMDPLSLRDGRKRGSVRGSRLDAESAAFVAAHIRQYSSRNKPTKVMVYKDYVDALDAANAERMRQHLPPLTQVCRRTFERKINQLDPFSVIAGREGEDAAMRKFALTHRGLEASFAFERVEMDEWKVTLHNLLIDAGLWEGLSEEAKAIVLRGRIWMTGAIDVASKCVVAMRFLNAAPSAESSISALEMIVFSKAHTASVIGAETPWDMEGTPDTIATDSGAAFISEKYLSAVHDIGARDFRPPAGMPWLRGSIERLFRTCQTQIMARFPGQSFENVLIKGDYDAEANACLNIEELNRVFLRAVLDIYHNTPHSGLAGETPRNAWCRLRALFGITPPPSPEIRRHVFGIPLKRRIANRGISVLGLHYQSIELQRLRAKVGQKPILIRVDRYDLGAISVRVDQGWMSVPCTFGEMSGATYWEWIAAVEDLHRRNATTSALSEDTVRRAYAHVRETAEMASARAELGTPVLTEEAFRRMEERLFRSFAFATDHPDDGSDFLMGDLAEEHDAPAPHTDLHRIALSADDQFGFGDDDWLKEE